jgi:hypothetical protein
MIAIFIGRRILPYLTAETEELSAANSGLLGSTSVIFAIVTFASSKRAADFLALLYQLNRLD